MERKLLGYAYRIENKSMLFYGNFIVETYAVIENNENNFFYVPLKTFDADGNDKLIEIIDKLDKEGYKTIESWYYETALIKRDYKKKSR